MAESCLLYYITDRTALGTDEAACRQRLLEKIAEAAQAGVDYIQLREKDLPTHDLEQLAKQATSVLQQLGTENRELRTALLINSRTDVALATAAQGVHLRSEDISPEDVRNIWKKCGAGAHAREPSPREPRIAVSCHSPKEVVEAAKGGATLAVLAPIFEKKDAPEARPTGLEILKEACKADIPVLALGGITIANARSCLEAGAAGIAAIRLFQENKIEDIVRALRH
jgi:thiamine-phosphate pyrophosphorylase